MTAMVPDILNAQKAIEDMAEQNMCVICQDEMDVQSSKVALRCGHEYHASCILKHLYKSTQCPICRDDPNWTSEGSEVDPDEELEEPRVLFCEALKKAEKDKKSDPVIARMFKTVRAHNDNHNNAQRKLRNLRAEIAPHVRALDKRIETYSKKATDAHDKRHKKTRDAMFELRKIITKSRKLKFACKQRIAAKYGYVRIPYRSRVRSRNLGAVLY